MLFLNDVSFFICLPNYEKNTKSSQDISPHQPNSYHQWCDLSLWWKWTCEAIV